MELKADRLNNQQLKTVDSFTMQRRINPREANRMMQRMGMQVKQVDDVTRVIIESASNSKTTRFYCSRNPKDSSARENGMPQEVRYCLMKNPKHVLLERSSKRPNSW